MTIKESYEIIGGDYDGVLARFRGEERIRKFAGKFLDDTSFADLCKYLEEKNYAEAFRAVHTLKGIAQNLGFTRLYEASHVLTEALRDGNPGDISAFVEQLTQEYQKTAATITAGIK